MGRKEKTAIRSADFIVARGDAESNSAAEPNGRQFNR